MIAPESGAVQPRVAIVIPAYNAHTTLPRVLQAARAAAGGARPRAEILVVDAGSDDDTGAIARAAGVRVLRLPQRQGPARARNLGVAEVDADVVLFIDADCAPHPGLVERVRAAFASDPNLASITGSYDAAPPEPGFFSQYMNLRHHFTHSTPRDDDAGFWAGCGAVRRSAFLAAGGFDAERYPRPQIEDIELGLRLAEHGRTARDPSLQVTHLKRWTLRSVIETDIRARAIPWSRLILERGAIPDDLNLSRKQRLAALLAPLVGLSLLSLPVLLTTPAWPLLPAPLLVIGASLALHRGFIRCMSSARGPLFGLGAWAFQQVHLSYSGLTFALCWITRAESRPRGSLA